MEISRTSVVLCATSMNLARVVHHIPNVVHFQIAVVVRRLVRTLISGRREAYPPSTKQEIVVQDQSQFSIQSYLQQISVSRRAVGPSFGNGADWAYLCFCFVQRREIMEVKCSQSFVLFEIVFFVGCIGFGYRLGQARIRSIALFCLVVLKQPGGRRCNSEDVIILIE